MSIVKDSIQGTKEILSSTIGAPSWVKQIAESLILIAGALSIVGINFEPYFKARSEVAILTMKAELNRKYGSSDSLIVKLEARIEELEKDSHKGR